MSLKGVGILVLLIASLASARFSQFISINPSNMNDQKNVSVQVKKKGADYIVQVSEINQSDGWLVQTQRPLTIDEQNFRNLIWKNQFDSVEVLSKKKVYPHHNKVVDRSGKVRKNELELVINESVIKSSYLYFDNEKEVQDGGYYYTIDLPQFVKVAQ